MRTLIACLAVAMLTGCSIRKMAVNKIGNALAAGGSTFESDDDPELVGQAVPFSLKLMESLLAESPRHKGLLLAAASGFTAYSYAYVDQAADEALAESLERSDALRARARRLYLRARAYGVRGLDVSCPGIGSALDSARPAAALIRARRRDVPLLYWTAAAHGLAISASRDDAEMIAQLPVVEAMIDRVMQLDESWGRGSLQEFLMTIESIRAGIRPEEQQARIKGFFDKARALSGDTRAATYVGYAEDACVPAQDRAGFKAMLARALAIDPGSKPEIRLANLVAQRRARWLLSRIDELFLKPDPSEN